MLEVGATVKVKVEATFSFSIFDSIDRDYVSMSNSVCATEETFHTNILLTLSGNFSNSFDELHVEDIEVLGTIEHAEFGDVKPNWMNDHEEFYSST